MFSKTIDSKTSYTNNDNVELIDLSKSIFKESVNSSVVYSYYKVGKGMSMRPDKISYAVFSEDTYAEMIMKYSFIDNPFAIKEGDIIAVPTMTSMYTDVSDLLTSDGNADDNYKYVKNFHKYIDSSKIPEILGSSGSSVSTSNTGSSLNSILSTTTDNVSVDISFDNLGIRESYGNVMGYGSEYSTYDSGVNGNKVNNGGSTESTSSGTAGSSSYNGVVYDDSEDTDSAIYSTTNGGASYDDSDNDTTNETYSSSQNYGPVEANLANNGKSGITLVNGRVYFGDSNVSANTNDVTDVDGTNVVDSPYVDCARAGITIGQFLNATLKNTVKSK